MIKSSIHQEDNSSFKYVYALNNMVYIYKAKLDKTQRRNRQIGDFNTDFLLIEQMDKKN